MTKVSRRPTQKTIAELTGLAVTTISRALQDDPKIAAATRQQVAQVAQDIGYVPDRAARHLRTGKTYVISLILNQHDEILGFSNSLISGLSQALEETDYHLTITPSFNRSDDIEPIRRLVQNGLADGIVLTQTLLFDERVRYLLDQNVPFVTHGRTDFSRAHTCVDFDNEAFAYSAALRLAKKGCHKLAIILPRDIFTFHHHMRQGFMKAINETGLGYVIPEHLSLESAPSEIREWLADLYVDGPAKNVDGFVCPGEASYLGLMAGLRDMGLARGRDYDAVVKCNSVILEQIDPDVDCTYEDIRAAGLQMGQALLSVLCGEGTGAQQVIQTPRNTFKQESA